MILLLPAVWIISACSPGEPERGLQTKDEANTPVYDSILTRTLGADDYGMKQYMLAFLKLGLNRDQDSATISWLQQAQLDNITRLANEKKLVLAGPFLDDGDIRGIYLFDVRTLEEAQVLTETDPAVKAGRVVMELHPWYGSAALMKIDETHKTTSIKEI